MQTLEQKRAKARAYYQKTKHLKRRRPTDTYRRAVKDVLILRNENKDKRSHRRNYNKTIANFKRLTPEQQKRIYNLIPDVYKGDYANVGGSISSILGRLLRSVLNKNLVRFVDNLSNTPGMAPVRRAATAPPYGIFNR